MYIVHKNGIVLQIHLLQLLLLLIFAELKTLTLIRSVLYRLVHFFLKLFLNTDALSKKNLKKIVK